MNSTHGDAFDICTESDKYDLVLWQMALHHMPDVDAALAWSRKVLRPGGLLVMHEYVGAIRCQFEQEILDINTDFRRSLPEMYLKNPWFQMGKFLSKSSTATSTS